MHFASIIIIIIIANVLHRNNKYLYSVFQYAICMEISKSCPGLCNASKRPKQNGVMLLAEMHI